MFSYSRMLWLICASFAVLILGSESGRILFVTPTPSISHQTVYRPFLRELTRRGHEVVSITTDPAYPKGKTPNNYTEIDLHDVSYGIYKDVIAKRSGKNELDQQMETILEVYSKVFQAQVKSGEVQKLLDDKRKTFDLIFIEMPVRPAYVLSHLYKAPVILFTTLGGTSGSFEMIGASVHPKLYPYYYRRRLYDTTLWEDVRELYTDITLKRILRRFEILEDNILRHNYGPGGPQIDGLRENVGMLFLSIHNLWDFNRPVPRNVIYLSGIHQKASIELPQELKAYLDNSVNGVVYMSLGTNLKPSTLSKTMIDIFLAVFSRLPYDFLLKWDHSHIENCPKNVKIGKWFPQPDMLKHPNVKVFITQGGQQSTDEAIDAGVPLIGIPFKYDQWANVEKCEFLKIGIKLNADTLTEEQLRNAIETIISDNTYRQNLLKHRALMYDQPQTALARAVWWTEHVLRYGTAHLQAPASRAHWTEYYEIDLILLMLSTAVGGFLMLVCSLRKLFINK